MKDKYLIDTSSLLAFVKYYLPLDRQDKASNFVEGLFYRQKLILIKEIYLECQNLKQGIILQNLSYLKHFQSNKNYSVTKKYHNLIDNHWVRNREKRKLTVQEYQAQKSNFIQSADFRLILYAMEENFIGIITEETPEPNDNKLFHKIPKICKIQKIECISLPDYFKDKLKINKT